MHPEIPDRLAHIIRERMDDVFGGSAEDGLAWLADDVLGDEARALALLDGTEVNVGERERALLGETLGLSPDLLGVCCVPTSGEVIRHVLAAALADGDARCPECRALSAELTHVGSDDGALAHLLTDALEHIWVTPEPEIEAETARLDEIMRLVTNLSPAGQARVLAACFEEREREAAAELSPRDAVARFREEFVPAHVRALLDVLALADDEGLAEPDLLSACHLADERDLARTLEALAHAGQLFGSIHAGYARLGHLVTLSEGRWRLDPALAGTLRALVRAERHQRRREAS